MELKYYLRGLGLGIVVTAIIMGIVSSRSRTMTDDEVIARAKQLGMIEDRVLSAAASDEDGASDDNSDAGENEISDEIPANADSFQQADNAQNGSVSPAENTPSDENDLSAGAEEMTAENDTSAAVLPDDEETGQEEAPAGPDEVETQNAEGEPEDSAGNMEAGGEPGVSDAPMVITVGSGDGSYTVSKKLEDVGAVASASDFDTFLCENGYDKRIRAGSYTIPAGAGDDKIARMITGLE